MKIAILGHGKMGKEINKIALKKKHDVIYTSSSKNPAKSLDLSVVDVAIDFSTPTTAFDNIKHAIMSKTPVISGTTGWLERLYDIHKLCIEKKGSFLHASNFSISANILFEMNKKLAELIKNYNYNIEIIETHHTEKLDTPSGTAIKLSNQIQNILKKEPKITANRIGETTGIHQVNYSSKFDSIEIKHIAKNRNSFAEGALIAAEWIIGKKGIFTLQDIFNQ